MKGWKPIASAVCAALGTALCAPVGAWVGATVLVEGSSQGVDWTIPAFPSEEAVICGVYPISELNWRFWTMGARLDVVGIPEDRSWLLWGKGNLGGIVSGRALDRDWAAPNRALEVSRARSVARGFSGNAQVRWGYLWSGPAVAVSPYLGWVGGGFLVRDWGLIQEFALQPDGLQRWLSEDGCYCVVEGSFEAAVANYEVRSCDECAAQYGAFLNGMVLGAAFWAYPEWLWSESESPMSFRLDGWVGLSTWTALADWPFREEFAHPCSFYHRVPMWNAGVEQMIRFDWPMGWNLTLAIHGDGAWSARGGGEEVIYYQDGTLLRSRVEHVKWLQGSILLGVGKMF
jgi:hypothetical protein